MARTTTDAVCINDIIMCPFLIIILKIARPADLFLSLFCNTGVKVFTTGSRQMCSDELNQTDLCEIKIKNFAVGRFMKEG